MLHFGPEPLVLLVEDARRATATPATTPIKTGGVSKFAPNGGVLPMEGSFRCEGDACDTTTTSRVVTDPQMPAGAVPIAGHTRRIDTGTRVGLGTEQAGHGPEGEAGRLPPQSTARLPQYLNVCEPIGGRQVAHSVIDPERAPLVKVAFDLYATGEWTIERSAEEMAHRGIRNRGRDCHYSTKALTVSGTAHLLAHCAYVGVVERDGVEYPASHEPIVERATFDKVQELLAARAMRGTRERRHHHYLKGLLVCGVCGRRLSIQYSKGTYT